MKSYKKIFQETDRLPQSYTITKFRDYSDQKDACMLPVTAFFKNGYSYPKALDDFIENLFTYEYDHDEEKWQAMWDGLPNKVIPIEKIIPTQINLDSRKIDDVKVPIDAPKSHLVGMNGFFYVMDGHHRIAAMIKNNQPIRAKVLMFKKPGKITLGR